MKGRILVSNRLIHLLIFTIIIGFTIGCKKNDNSPSNSGGGGNTGGTPGTNEVWMQNISFVPTSISVSAGTTIKWTNKDNVSHTVTSNTGLFDSGIIGAGGTFSHKFDSTGTYNYHCTIHSGMNGTVIVN